MAFLLQLYTLHGYEVRAHTESSKQVVFTAAGIEDTHDGERFGFGYAHDFNRPNALEDWSGSKVAANINAQPLPTLHELDDTWNLLAAVNLEDAFDFVRKEVRAEMWRHFSDLPRPWVLIHGKGNSWSDQKNIPDGALLELYRSLLRRMPGSLILLDWQDRMPSLTQSRMRPLKAWGHISIEQLACLMNNSDLLIGIDSGPYHLAAMTHLPALGVFHAFHPSCVSLPRASGKNRALARKNDVNFYRRRRWGIVEYEGEMPTGEFIAETAIRMLRRNTT